QRRSDAAERRSDLPDGDRSPVRRAEAALRGQAAAKGADLEGPHQGRRRQHLVSADGRGRSAVRAPGEGVRGRDRRAARGGGGGLGVGGAGGEGWGTTDRRSAKASRSEGHGPLEREGFSRASRGDTDRWSAKALAERQT